MANRWNIRRALEQEIIHRDTKCVYCGVLFAPESEAKASKPTWEHIVNDARIVNRYNIARCCAACNASKGAKDLVDWLQSDYCKRRGITEDTVADVVKQALETPPRLGQFES